MNILVFDDKPDFPAVLVEGLPQRQHYVHCAGGSVGERF